MVKVVVVVVVVVVIDEIAGFDVEVVNTVENLLRSMRALPSILILLVGNLFKSGNSCCVF